MFCRIGYTCERCHKSIEEDNGCECVKKGLQPIYPKIDDTTLDEIKLKLDDLNEINEFIIPERIEMSNDWSLKGKGIKTWDTKNPKDEWLTYKDKDIETLRKKLIEDIKKDCIEWHYIVDIINRRFGVEE